MTAATPQVVIVGGGPAGLAAALELRCRKVGVLVLDREQELGGIPRHARHQGFGVRDLHRVLSGPAYARRYVELARAAGVELLAEATVTGWSPGGALEITSPHGRESLTPDAVLLATGCRERPRPARLVPGSRPEGVLTTGMLQQLVYLRGRRPGSRALVVGAEHVSFSALQTLAHGGARVVGMVTELPLHQTLALVRIGARLRYRTPLLTRTAVTAIHGVPRVEEVELTDVDSSETRRVACDTVVFTADWIPDHELAVLAGAALDPGTRGPAVDLGLRTTRPGLFAAGNVTHAAEPADIAALSGRRVAAAVIRYLDGVPWPALRVPVECVEPLYWISPNAVTAADPSADAAAFRLRAREILGTRTVEIAQDGRLLWRGRVKRLMPGRSALLPAHWTDNVDPSGTAVSVRTAPR